MQFQYQLVKLSLGYSLRASLYFFLLLWKHFMLVTVE